MRGIDVQPRNLFSYIQLEQRVPSQHPLRAIRKMVDVALGEMDALFTQMYSGTGRPSIAPERLLRAQMLKILYTVRSERQLMEQIAKLEAWLGSYMALFPAKHFHQCRLRSLRLDTNCTGRNTHA
ncbi:MAG: transposase [Burkholderiales bacterium]|nr:transposase [Burkholderiales bacterium]